MNESNGGLVAKLDNRLLICDLSKYSGTYAISEDGATVWNTKSLMWFVSSDGHGFYYSNQRNFDYLTYLDGRSMDETCVLKKACMNLVMCDSKLLFIDEEESIVYEYDPAKGKSSPVIKEKVYSFICASNTIYFASENGLKCFDMHSRRMEKLMDCYPVCLNYADGQLVFADKNRDFALCKFDIICNKIVTVEDIRTQSIAVTEEYIFAANLDDNSSIVRVGLATGDIIRFCGDGADKIHVIEDYLYFLNLSDSNAWYRVPVSGGRPVAVLAG